MSKKRGAAVPDAVWEVVEAPGVKPSGPPVPVAVVEVEPSPPRAPILPPAIGALQVSPEVAGVVREWAPRVRAGVELARAVVEEVTTLRDSLAALGIVFPSPAPRVRARRPRKLAR